MTAREFQPRLYQVLIIDAILRNERIAIWAGMGMGKTVATLTAVDLLQTCQGAGPCLVIAPLRVARTSWVCEAEKWKHLEKLRVVNLYGSQEVRERQLQERCDVVTCNYEQLPWLVEYWGNAWPYRIVVADESTRLKAFRTHSGGTRAKALAKVAFSKVRRFIELTGTPAPNGLLDLWGQLWFIDKGERLGTSMSRYQERWFRPIRVGSNIHALKWELRDGAEAEIQDAVRDITLKINTEEWFDLDQPVTIDVPVTLSKECMRTYRQLERQLFAEIDGHEVEAVNAAVKSGLLLQCASGAVYTDGDEMVVTHSDFFSELHHEKLDALGAIIENADGKPVLVSYQYRHEKMRILNRFAKLKPRVLNKDPQTIKDWNDGKIQILLAHPASCGHGLSLQDGGNILVFFSTGWNLEEHDQMIERIGPMRQKQSGYNRPVLVYNIIAAGTIDETVQQRIKTKRSVMDVLLERREHVKHSASH